MYKACAVASEGKQNLYCWTNRRNSGIGNNIHPEIVSNFKNQVSKVVVGQNHICAIDKNNGEIICTGDNSYGQLGNGSIISIPLLSEFSRVSLANVKFIDLALSKNATCAISSLNDVYCFGRNEQGELGAQGFLSNTFSSLPQQIKSLKLKSISAGNNHFCGLLADAFESENKMVCWGDNSYGQTSSENLNKSPVKILSTSNVIFVAAGENTSCALDNNNKTFCFGSNKNNIITDDTNIFSLTHPVPVQKNMSFKTIHIGNYEVCGIKIEDNTPFCWGKRY